MHYCYKGKSKRQKNGEVVRERGKGTEREREASNDTCLRGTSRPQPNQYSDKKVTLVGQSVRRRRLHKANAGKEKRKRDESTADGAKREENNKSASLSFSRSLKKELRGGG